MGITDGRTGAVVNRVAVPDTVLHRTPFPSLATGCLTLHLFGLRITGAAFGTCAVTPELLIWRKDSTLKNTSTGVLGDALSSIQHEALIALAGLNTV